MYKLRCVRVVGLVIVGICMIASDVMAQEVLWKKSGVHQDDVFGWQVAICGDVDGDGRSDVLVGVPGDNTAGAGAGKVVVLRGVDGSEVTSVYGLSGQFFGDCIAGGVDINQDGIGDFIVTAVDDSRGALEGGAYEIYSGSDGALLREEIGAITGLWLGNGATTLADLDGDGVRDYAIGVGNLNGSQPYVNVYSGATGLVLFTLVPTPGTASAAFGFPMADAGDLNGDGVTDLVVGDYNGAGVNGYAGRVYTFSGADGTNLYVLDGEQNGEQFGWAVDRVGDVDLDGVDDFIVGAPDYWNGFTDGGKIYVYSGRTGGLLYSHLGTNFNPVAMGYAVSGVGDINSDGVPDYCARSFPDDPCASCSAVYFFSGSNGLQLYHLLGPDASAFGISLDGGADLDADGRMDLLAGASGDIVGGVRVGSAYVCSLEHFYCDAQPKTQHVGGTVTVQMAQTTPGNLVGLALVAIDGVPTFSFLALAPADSLGRLVVSDKVPRGWSKHDIDLQGFAIGFSGKVVASSVEHVEFQ